MRLFVAVALAVVLAAGCGLEDSEAASTTTTTSTTTAPTEAEASTALQEMFADWTEQDCADEAVWYYEFYTPYESEVRDAMLADIEAERFLEAQSNYWTLWTLTNVALNDHAGWMEVCAPKSSPALVAEVEAFPLVVEEARDDLVAECYEIQAQLIAEDRLVDSSGGLLVWSDCIPPA